MCTPSATSPVRREASIANEDATSMNVIQMASVLRKSCKLDRAMGTMVDDSVLAVWSCFAGHGELVCSDEMSVAFYF